jgi:hypothetical protein
MEHVRPRVCRKKKFQKTSREKMKTREIINYKKSRGEQEKIVSRKSDENKRKLFKKKLRRNYF